MADREYLELRVSRDCWRGAKDIEVHVRYGDGTVSSFRASLPRKVRSILPWARRHDPGGERTVGGTRPLEKTCLFIWLDSGPTDRDLGGEGWRDSKEYRPS